MATIKYIRIIHYTEIFPAVQLGGLALLTQLCAYVCTITTNYENKTAKKLDPLQGVPTKSPKPTGLINAL